MGGACTSEIDQSESSILTQSPLLSIILGLLKLKLIVGKTPKT